MWNRAEPGSRFRAAAPNHPKALLEEPHAFQAVGGKISRIKKAFDQGKKKNHRSRLLCYADFRTKLLKGDVWRLS